MLELIRIVTHVCDQRGRNVLLLQTRELYFFQREPTRTVVHTVFHEVDLIEGGKVGRRVDDRWEELVNE